jgi:hypothetical protein
MGVKIRPGKPDEILRMAGLQGVEKISPGVVIENPALHLYRGHGFKPA